MSRIKLRLIGVKLATLVASLVGFRIFASWYGRIRARESSKLFEDKPIDFARPTIVILHGLGGSAYQIEAMLAPELIPFANVITIDLPGHGGKQPSQGGDYSIEAQARWLYGCIAEKLSRRGLDSCVLFGISFGGELMTRLMIDLGREAKLGIPPKFKVDGFIAFEPPYRGEYAKRWQRKLFKIVWYYYQISCATSLKGSPTAQQLVVELTARFVRRIGGIDRARQSLNLPSSKKSRPELFEHFCKYNDDHLDWEQWLSNIHEILTYDSAEHIQDFLPNVPILLMTGADSNDPIVDTCERLAEDLSGLVSDITISVIPGSHHAAYENADIAANHIELYLETSEIL